MSDLEEQLLVDLQVVETDLDLINGQLVQLGKDKLQRVEAVREEILVGD